MAEALFTDADYTSALLALLPIGRAWSRAPDSLQAKVMGGLAPSYVRLDARAQSLLVDAFPATTVELLPEWEASLGLPDPCEGPGQGIEQRRAQVVARLVNAGGQSAAYFLGVLARLGYTNAAITQYAPFRACIDAVESPLYGEPWAFHWNINLPDLRVFYFQADVSSVGEALVIISDDAVGCVIAALKPAHTTVSFTNDPVSSAGILDFSDPDQSGFLGVI